MRRKLSVETGLLGFMVLFTVGHIGYQYARSWRPAPIISTFELGSTLPRLDYRLPGRDSLRTVAPVGAGQCRLLVVFSPTCPHCHTAAVRDAGAPDAATRLPITWAAVANGETLNDFAARLRPGSVVRYVPDAKDQMKVQGVPAGFLVAPDGTVRYVWVFLGTENHDELRAKCASPAPRRA